MHGWCQRSVPLYGVPRVSPVLQPPMEGKMGASPPSLIHPISICLKNNANLSVCPASVDPLLEESSEPNVAQVSLPLLDTMPFLRVSCLFEQILPSIFQGRE